MAQSRAARGDVDRIAVAVAIMLDDGAERDAGLTDVLLGLATLGIDTLDVGGGADQQVQARARHDRAGQHADFEAAFGLGLPQGGAGAGGGQGDCEYFA